MGKRKRENKVALVASDGTRIELGIPHAERLLDMGPKLNGGYTLAPDSGYAYDEENGLRPVSASKRAPEVTEE